jgi:hypothetical protein
MQEETLQKVQKVISILSGISSNLSTTFSGVKGRTLYARSRSTLVTTSARFWQNIDNPSLDKRFYQVEFSMTWTQEATTEQLVGAIKYLAELKADCPVFSPEESLAIDCFLFTYKG